MEVDGQALGQEAVVVRRINVDALVQQCPGVLPNSPQGHLHKASVPEMARHEGSANAVRATDMNPNRLAPRRTPESFHLLPLSYSIMTVCFRFGKRQLV